MTPVHLLGAFVEDGAAWRKHLPPACREELVRLIAMHLSALPASGAYRDGIISELPLDDETAALLQPTRRLVFLREPLDQTTLLTRLVALPVVRALYAGALMDMESIDMALTAALGLATARRHAEARLTHVLRNAVERRWFRHAVESCGYAVARLVAVLDGRLDDLAMDGHVRPTLNRLLDHAASMARAHVITTGCLPTVDRMLLFALREGALKGHLQEAGIAEDVLLTFLVHGVGPSDPVAPPRGGDVEVVLHDDDFTAEDRARRVLERYYGLGHDEARQVILLAHRDGQAVIGRWSTDDARHRTAAARADAAASKDPLRITLRSRA